MSSENTRWCGSLFDQNWGWLISMCFFFWVGGTNKGRTNSSLPSLSCETAVYFAHERAAKCGGIIRPLSKALMKFDSCNYALEARRANLAPRPPAAVWRVFVLVSPDTLCVPAWYGDGQITSFKGKQSLKPCRSLITQSKPLFRRKSFFSLVSHTMNVVGWLKATDR